MKLGALVAAAVYPVARFLSPPRVPEAATFQVEAGRVNDPELLDAGFKIIRFGQEPVIVIRIADGDYRLHHNCAGRVDQVAIFRGVESWNVSG